MSILYTLVDICEVRAKDERRERAHKLLVSS
jgi:hypothetical protein